MIFEPRIFYQTYLKDYHKDKARYLKGMLDNLPKYEQDFFGKELNETERTSFRRTLKSDLRQTYFHAIETFFELFFALNPHGKKSYDDEFVLYTLTYSEWHNTFKKIKEISENEKALDFLDEKIVFFGSSTTIGNFLFYNGIYSTENFPQELFTRITESIEAIKYGIKTIASDFVKREEYNAYKHGLRIIPSISKLMVANVETMDVKMEWDLSESMSFYMKTNYPDELKVVTKIFDAERDYLMINFCSNLIHHLIYYRRIAMKFEKGEDDSDKFPITFFGKEPIDKCNKMNVSVQDIVYSVTRKDSSPQKKKK